MLIHIIKSGEEFYAPILCVFKYAAHQLGGYAIWTDEWCSKCRY